MAATGRRARLALAAAPVWFPILLSTILTSRSDAVEIIGHRGASSEAPENTLASFRLAWAQNADAGELDIYLSKDGEVVVIHDATTRRVGKRSRKVVDQTLAELKQLDVGQWKGSKWSGERIPTLAEVLDTIPDGKRLFIEIKCGPEVIPPLVKVLETARKRPNQTCLIGFSYDVMKRAKQALPGVKCYWIVQMRRSRATERWLPPVDQIIQRAKDAELDGVDFGDTPAIDESFVSKIKHSGLNVYVWTVDSIEEAERLSRAGVDGITTNSPGLLKEHFSMPR